VVFVAGARERGTVSGPSGSFALHVPAGAVRVSAARLGFVPETVTVAARDTLLALRLREAPLTLAPTLVRAERSLTAASSAVVRALDVELRPRESSQELLRLVPGLVIAQHAGGGKAEQIFLRGFDADHGTDVAVSVDGTPVNMVSHAHGQGYADLHFLMPEVVEGADVRKGPYDARDGDLATAGAVAFRTKDRLARREMVVRGGSFRTGHATGLVPLGGDASRPGGYVAASAHATDGPFERPQGYRRLNGFAKWTHPLTPSAQLVATASAFTSDWRASGQIPERAVASGLVGRFGELDPTEGGDTRRHDAAVGVRSVGGGESDWEARLYAARYALRLFSNFTFFLADTGRGDGIEQVDDRTMVGGEGRYGRDAVLLGRRAAWRLGAGGRGDVGRVSLFRQSGRERHASLVDADVRQTQLFLWADERVDLTPRSRLVVGVRGDLFRFGVDDRLAGRDAAGEVGGPGGARWAGVVSPKAGVAIDLSDAATLFANVGAGFHSNDARAVVAARGEGARPLPRARGGEVGSRYTWTGGSVAVALWALDLASELVYVGDEGTTEASGRTRRVGADLEGRVRLTRWLWLDADLNLARGRFRDAPAGEDRVPLAPTVTSTGGVTVRDLGAASGGVRYRHVGARPADESGAVVARGSTIWELFGRLRAGRVDVLVAVDNLFDARWNEAQFATTSRLRGEAGESTELHFTPGAPRGVQLGVGYDF
jgi:hypothetical protein